MATVLVRTGPRPEGDRGERVRLGIVAVAMLLGGVSCSSAQKPEPPPVPDRWKHLTESDLTLARKLRDDFDAGLRRPYKNTPWKQVLVRMSKRGQSMTYYYLQHSLDPILTMYEATGQESYLSFALELCENMVAAADQDRDGDGHPEWDGRREGHPPPKRPDILLQDFQGACPIIRAARIILTDESLKKRYGTRAKALADFVEKDILHKWMIERSNLTYWRRPRPWLDKMSMLIRMELDLHAITGKEEYLEIAREFANRCMTRVTRYDANQDTYTWVTPGDDTSHTNREVTMALTCFEAGLVFQRRDIRRITNTFLKLIWDGSSTAPAFRNYHDGRNGAFRDHGPYEAAKIYDGWIKLGKYDLRVQQIGLTVWEQIKARNRSARGAKVNDTPHGRLGMPANLLRNIVERDYDPVAPDPPAGKPKK